MFDSSVIGVWTLNYTLDDEVMMNHLSADGSYSDKYMSWNRFKLDLNQYESIGGLSFLQSYSTESTISLSGSFTIMFWYYSPEPLLFTKHDVYSGIAPRQSPIIGIGDQNSPGLSITNASFVISEIASTTTSNAILVRTSSDGVTFPSQIMSESYLPGIHHVSVTYLAEESLIRVDIDGKTGVYGLSVPVKSSSTNLRVNRLVVDSVGHIKSQPSAFLSEVILLNSSSAGSEPIDHIRFGWQKVTDSLLIQNRNYAFGISFHQESTVSTTGIYTEGDSVYVTRSNGKVLKGVSSMWNRIHEFKSKDDLQLITISKSGTYSVSSDKGLLLSGALVRE